MAQEPLAKVFRRGAVFLWHRYPALDDPALAGETKPKFLVVLNNSPADDPIVFLLATSEKPKHATKPFLFRLPAGSYDFFSLTTLLPIATAGQTDIDRDSFVALYDSNEIKCVGCLSEADAAQIIADIKACPLVQRRFKQTLG